jgi:hypothetical protein
VLITALLIPISVKVYFLTIHPASMERQARPDP